MIKYQFYLGFILVANFWVKALHACSDGTKVCPTNGPDPVTLKWTNCLNWFQCEPCKNHEDLKKLCNQWKDCSKTVSKINLDWGNATKFGCSLCYEGMRGSQCNLKGFKYTNWMASLSEEKRNLPINKLAFPGSHDSFTSELTDIQAVDFVQKITTTIGKGKKRRKISKRFVDLRPVSITQNLNMKKQLELGIRYLDLRICNENGILYFCHNTIGGKVYQGIREQINTFINENPSEIVLLDFQKFYQVDSKTHYEIAKFLETLFGNKIIPYTTNMKTLTLNNLNKRKQQVLILYNHDLEEYTGRKFWPREKSIHSAWANSASDKDVMNLVQKEHSIEKKENKFNVLQGVLTFKGTSNYLSYLVSGKSLENISKNFHSTFVKWLQKLGGQKTNEHINIVIMDFVEKAGFIPTMVDFNKLNYVF